MELNCLGVCLPLHAFGDPVGKVGARDQAHTCALALPPRVSHLHSTQLEYLRQQVSFCFNTSVSSVSSSLCPPSPRPAAPGNQPTLPCCCQVSCHAGALPSERC